MDIIALLNELIKGIYEAQSKFYEEPKEFYGFEKRITEAFRKGAAEFIGLTLTETDELLEKNAGRKVNYEVQRHDERTLITTAGDVVFRDTLYRSKKDGKYRHLLGSVLGRTDRERFSEAAEAELLKEAVRTSYERASKVLPSKSGITKTTVMNKVHRAESGLPERASEKKKEVKKLYIEADEDHVSEQHGRGSKGRNRSFISRIAYVYEDKEDVCRGRKKLTGVRYIGGLYEGTEGVRAFWEKVSEYIRNNYDYTGIEKIYISGDGAAWIKAGCGYIAKSEFAADKFHLMKYINAACNRMLGESDLCRSDIYRMLNKREKKRFKEYTDSMAESVYDEEPIKTLQSYVLNNWSGVMAAFHDESVKGCSAEGHVSHVLSERLSSRPMGWSRRGADRMSALRCFVKNEGEEKIIELVRYMREGQRKKKTGTDDSECPKIRFYHTANMTDGYSTARSYIDRIQATIPGMTARKSYAIRNQLRLI